MKKLLPAIVLLCTLKGAPLHAAPPFHKHHIAVKVCKRSKHAVRISPLATAKGSIKIVSTCTRSLHFYVFDMEGSLVSQAKLAPFAKVVIRNLPQGEFAYDVFMDDEGVEQGKLTVR